MKKKLPRRLAKLTKKVRRTVKFNYKGRIRIPISQRLEEFPNPEEIGAKEPMRKKKNK